MAKNNSYGIKEVADVKFIKIPAGATAISAITADSEGIKMGGSAIPTDEIAYQFDSLKVSNIEVASEDTSARGGKGNPELISWSYGKEVTFTMEDALISMDTLALWLGGTKDNETVTIDADTFPEMYTIVGETVMRSYATGKDEPFYFVIPKGKINVSGTVTMEAEGDPSTFEMTIKAMSATVGNDSDVLVKFLHVAS